MHSVSEVEIKSLLKKMICSPFYSHFIVPYGYEDFYENLIKVDVAECVEPMKNGLRELDTRVYRKRITASRAYIFAKHFDFYEENAIDIEVEKRFIRRHSYYPSSNQQSHVLPGLVHEKEALMVYQSMYNVDIKFIKDIIHPNFPFLIGQTDGLICNNGCVEGIIEVKSPETAANYNIEDYIKIKNPFSVRYNHTDGRFYLNERSQVYYQIQMCLAILNIDWGVVIFYSSFDKSILPINVYKNNEFIQILLFKLEIIYKNYILPKLYNILK